MGRLIYIVLAAVFLSCAGRRAITQPGAHDQPAVATNAVSLARRIVLGHFGWTNFDLDVERQREINTLALDLAKEVALCATQGGEAVQRGVKAGSGLAALCQDGLVTDPQVIPYLLTGLKAKPYPNSFIAWYSLRSIVLMTRRMRGELDGNLLGGMTDPKRQSEVVAWWEHWWKINQSEHPVYDAEFDNKVRSAFLSVEQTIEEKIKPAHPELSLFHALTNMPRVRPLMALAQIYEHQYEPYYYSELMLGSRSSGTNALVYALRREDLPWLEVACRFADPEIPNNWRSPKAHQPPLRLATLLTSVYSNHIAGTSTYVEVKVASPNPDLVKDLKKALSGVR